VEMVGSPYLSGRSVVLWRN